MSVSCGTVQGGSVVVVNRVDVQGRAGGVLGHLKVEESVKTLRVWLDTGVVQGGGALLIGRSQKQWLCF